MIKAFVQGFLVIGEALFGIGKQLKRIADAMEAQARGTYVARYADEENEGSWVTYHDPEQMREEQAKRDAFRERGGPELNDFELPPRPIPEGVHEADIT